MDRCRMDHLGQCAKKSNHGSQENLTSWKMKNRRSTGIGRGRIRIKEAMEEPR